MVIPYALHVLAILRPALLSAASGIPVRARFPCTAAALAPLSEWLQVMAQEPVAGFSCFTCEFISCTA